jgi:hypothetical protein
MDDLENASDSIRIKCEFASNVIDESDSQCEKHLDPRVSVFLGIKIDPSDENENASNSIRVKREFDSNMIHESEVQCEKHNEPRILTCIAISISDVFEKLRIIL